MKLYHGSQEENFVPTFGLGNDGHDYGRGFYLTEFPELAKEWALAAICVGTAGYTPTISVLPLRRFHKALVDVYCIL